MNLSDKEKIKQYNREYRIKNRATINKCKREYYKNNKDEIKKKRREHYKEHIINNPWIGSFKAAKHRCNNPKNKSYKRYGGRGIQFKLTKKDIIHLWYRDNADMMDCATLDRIDNNGNYELSNCQFLERTENTRKGGK